jgi:hypothetical protein
MYGLQLFAYLLLPVLCDLLTCICVFLSCPCKVLIPHLRVASVCERFIASSTHMLQRSGAAGPDICPHRKQ